MMVKNEDKVIHTLVFRISLNLSRFLYTFNTQESTDLYLCCTQNHQVRRDNPVTIKRTTMFSLALVQ